MLATGVRNDFAPIRAAALRTLARCFTLDCSDTDCDYIEMLFVNVVNKDCDARVRQVSHHHCISL